MIQPSPRYEAEPARPPIRLVPERPAVMVADRALPDWHLDANRLCGTALLERLERAVGRGRARRAHRTRRELLATIQADRLARLEDVAEREGLRLERLGRGPLFDRPAVHRGRRRAWYLCPLVGRRRTLLPEGARDVLERWERHGDVFDAVFLADELSAVPRNRPTGIPVSCLVGVVSADGSSGDWFVLDRWIP